MARLTCVSCCQTRLVDGDIQVARISIGVWWTELRHHSCSMCFAHTRWEPVDLTVCFLDKGHPHRHLPWQDSYGDVVEGALPITDLWSTS